MIRNVEVSFQPGGSKLRRTVFSLRSLRALDGGVAGAVACVVDITDDAKLREELEQRVRYDALTGCLNQSSILAELQSRIADLGHRPRVAVLFVDLDDFKATNDRYGHVAGDRMLKHVATILRQVVGSDGLVGRVGGDEYLVVLPAGGSASSVRRVAHAIMDALRQPVLLGRDWVQPKASVGAAERPFGTGHRRRRPRAGGRCRDVPVQADRQRHARRGSR